MASAGVAGPASEMAETSLPNRETLRWMLETMMNIRTFEERLLDLFKAGQIDGVLHVCIGEEACAAGVCANLRPTDYLLTSHRGHGHMLAKGASMDRMMAELFARETGFNRARGGSMHVIDRSKNVLGANGIVAAGIPIAAGAALAAKMRGEDRVTVCFFGDGATNEGAFHEGLNLAALWNLPVVFVCENNLYAQFTPQRIHAKSADLFKRALAYDIPGVQADGQDALAVFQVASEAVERARTEGGPTLIELKTYRYTGHAISNPICAIGRPDEEIEAWKLRDPIVGLETYLLEAGLLSREEHQSLRAAAVARVDAAVEFAESSPLPSPETALENVYTELPAGAVL